MAGVTTPVRVMVVDDDPMVRAALSMMLEGAETTVVAEAGDGEEVPALLEAHPVDVVLMDLRMPRVDGITATSRLRTAHRAPQVVVLTTFDSDEEILGALRAGAIGFLLKDTPPAQIVQAVQRAAAGEPMVSPQVTRRLIAHAVDRSGPARRARAALSGLSDRERDVVTAIGRGATNAQIAEEMFLSVATVKAYVSQVLTKLALGNRRQVALLAHDAGLVPDD